MVSDFTWHDLWMYLFIYISNLLLYVPVAYHIVSHFLLCEKLIWSPMSAKRKTSVLGCCLSTAHTSRWSQEMKVCDTWFPNVETWRFLILSGKTTLLWGSCFREAWKGSALPLWDSFIQPLHLPSHQQSLSATKTQVLADFMITGTGILMLKERSGEFSL